MSIAQTPDYGYPYYYSSGDRNDTHGRLPVADIVGCTATGNRNCLEPTWTNGYTGTAYDLNNGAQVQQGSFANWSQSPLYCVSLGSYCLQNREYPPITIWQLPSLYYRTPAKTECYYYPESGATALSSCTA
jgi:hypothetical protein